jgi:hypothetical protein
MPHAYIQAAPENASAWHGVFLKILQTPETSREQVVALRNSGIAKVAYSLEDLFHRKKNA